MSTTIVDRVTGQELWESQIDGLIHIKRLDPRGEFVKDEIVYPHSKLHITPEERQLNQEAVQAGDAYDPFLNGFLAPLRLVDGNPDNERLKANPNVVTDDDIAAMLKAAPKTMIARLGQISNPALLERIYEAAVEADVSIKRANAIKHRLGEVRVDDLTVAMPEEIDPEDGAGKPRRRDRDERQLRPTRL